MGNVLDAYGDVDPSKIVVKMKLHLLAHLAQDIRCFGPAIQNSTEIFECFNGVFRLCSIYSSHQAPSRDIATKFASMDRLKHILAGGYWKEGKSWVQAGDNVLRVLQMEAIIQRHLGWVPSQQVVLGTYPRCHLSPVRIWLKYMYRQYSPCWEGQEPTAAMDQDPCFYGHHQSTSGRSTVANRGDSRCTVR